MLDCKHAAIRGARNDAAEYRDAIIATLDLFVRDTPPQSAGPSEVTAVLRSAVSQLLDGMKSLHKLASDYQDDPSDYNLQALLEEVLSETEKVIGKPMPF
jgi:hypothetical protein